MIEPTKKKQFICPFCLSKKIQKDLVNDRWTCLDCNENWHWVKWLI